MERLERSSRRARWAVALTLGLVGWLAVPATTAGADASGVEADWRMDEQRGATVLVDSSGNGHHGRIGAAVTTEVRLSEGVVHRFPWVTPPAGATGHVHLVPDSPSLDPGAGSYAVSLRFRTSQFDSNLAQKGQSGVSGGFWKVEVDDGRFRCLFRGSQGDASIGTPQRVDDGVWHSVACVRRDGRVRLELDGREVASTVDDAGVVDNDWELAIGGKSRCNQTTVGCDLFAGDIDSVRITDGVVK